MIPKIIHNAWFGRAEKSDLFKRCIESWHRIHPDWDYVEKIISDYYTHHISDQYWNAENL